MIRLLRAAQPSIVVMNAAPEVAPAVVSAAPVVSAASVAPSNPSTAYAVAYAAAAIGIGGGIALTAALDPGPFTPTDGFSALALFYIVAQAVERVIEPFTGLVTAKPAADGEDTKKPAAKAKRAAALVTAYRADAPGEQQVAVEVAAGWQKVIEEIRANTAIYAWGAATMLGALASGILGLYLMKSVGASAVPEWLDVIVTGLVVGGGSKGLHDLIKNVEKAKEEKEDPEEAA